MAPIKYTSKEQQAGMKLTDEKNCEKSEKKLTVLESHGYTLGKTIGAGSYATVKVKSTPFSFFSLPFSCYNFFEFQTFLCIRSQSLIDMIIKWQ